MPTTKIADVIIPELFVPYVIQQTKELSQIIQSGIAVSNTALDELVKKGGKTLNMPFWSPLVGADEVLSDNAPLTPAKITSGADVAALLLRGKAWGANELAGALAGSSPMEAIGLQVAQWWSIQEQKILIAVLTGIFGGTLSSHVNDISGGTGVGAVISAKAILDTKQLLGDAYGQLAAIVMHSAVFTVLQQQNLIATMPASQGVIDFPTYLGYKVIVDDGVPAAGGVYNTYLFGGGCFGRGDGIPTDLTPIETDRDSLGGEDYLITRRALVLHPFGVKWIGNASGITPNNTELATAANWQKVIDDKSIGMVMLKHKIG